MTKAAADPQAMALEAAARGWIGARELWQIAVAPRAQTRARLGELLDPDKLAALERAARAMTTMSATSHASGKRTLPRPPGVPVTVSEVGEPAPSFRPSRDPGGLPGRLPGKRYRGAEPLGAGGAGQVVASRDREIGRTVALKTLHDHLVADTGQVRKFLVEARVTAQLEHPGIVPVYDLGLLPDGRPYYTMRVVQKQSLGDVLSMSDRSRWPRVRLLGAFLQVCRALAYAHSRGVMHGDIKPENILLGDFGEVYLADWGLTRVAPQSTVRTRRSTVPPPGSDAEPGGGVLMLDTLDPHELHTSPPGGTPGYLAPEVAMGDSRCIDHRADLFSLGVVLYEILTGDLPFEGETARARVVATVSSRPRPPREIDPSCPLLLEDLCLGLLEKDREQRIGSADEVAERIEAFLEGAKEQERRRDEALKLCEQAREPAARHFELEQEMERWGRQARELLREIEGWRPIEDKRPGWRLQERAAEAERASARALAEAIELYTKALGYDAGCEAAREGLAELYWSRARQAEQERRLAAQIYYEALVLEHDRGRYAALLSAPAALSVRSSPPGAQVTLLRFRERDRVLVAGQARALGTCPIDRLELEPGSYLLLLSAPGYRELRCPVSLGRGEHQEIDLNLYTDAEIGDGFVLVPRGVVVIGGDAEALDPLPRQQVFVPDFAIAELPVTMREYCTFLDKLEQVGEQARARRRAPCDLRATVSTVQRGPDGRYRPHDLLIEGKARELFGPDRFWEVPICMITWFDAVDYCRWKSERDGHELRLLAEAEWEKAARGVDGRFFPWGDHFDPSFCLMRASRPFTHQAEPAGSFDRDVSPYGVRDLAGGMREWVADQHGVKSAAELAVEPEPAASMARAESGWRTVRSGGWNTASEWCRAASRSRMFAALRGMAMTFRCAKTLHPSGRR